MLQIYKRAASPTGAVRDGYILDPLRRLLSAAGLHRAAPLLHRAVGADRVAPARAHLLQPARPAALPLAAAAAREAAAGRRGDQHLRHRVKQTWRQPHELNASKEAQSPKINNRWQSADQSRKTASMSNRDF